jgi:hypothetical protein
VEADRFVSAGKLVRERVRSFSQHGIRSVARYHARRLRPTRLFPANVEAFSVRALSKPQDRYVRRRFSLYLEGPMSPGWRHGRAPSMSI